MKQVTMETQVRTKSGKGVARKLRSSGMLPGVLYGKKTEPVALAVNDHSFNRTLENAKGEKVLFTLEIKDNGSSQKRLAVVKDIQRHPVNERIRHVDFYEVFMDEEIKISVPITLVGKAKGVEIDKGIMDIIQREIEVACYPNNMPDEIQMHVTRLGLGEALHASDVLLPEGVRLLEDPRTTLVTITGSGFEAVEKTAEEIEEEKEVL